MDLILNCELEMQLNRSLENLVIADTKIWSKKLTRLEKFLVALVTFGICLIIACFVNIFIRNDKYGKPCESRSCIRISSQTIKQIDSGVNPCDDFFQFSCGKLITTTHEKKTPNKILRNEIEKRLDILSEPIEKNDHPIVKYQKELFEACKNSSEDDGSLETFKEILKEMNGWPVTLGEAWDESKFDLVDSIGNLRKNGLEFLPVLTVSLSKFPNKNKKIIKVSFPFLTRMRDVRLKLMVDVAVALGANKTTAIAEMTEVRDFVNAMAKSENEYLELVNGDLHEITYHQLQNMGDQHSGIDWLKVIDAILAPIAKVDSRDVVIFPNLKFTRAYLDFINKTSKRLLCNYILWYAIEDLLPLLSQNLREAYNNYRCLSGTSRRTQVEMCQLAISKNFGPIPAYLTYARKHLRKEVKEKIEDLYDRIKYEFVNLFKALPLNTETREKLQKSFEELGAVIGFKEKQIDDAVFDKFYRGDLEPLKDQDFLRTYLHFKWKVENVWIENVQAANISYTDLLLYYQIPKTETTYLLEEHALAIPVGMLHNLVYDDDKPMFFHFATLGRSIAIALFNIFHELEENDSNVWTNLIEIKCKRDGLFETNDELIGDDFERILLSEQIALKTTYAAYKRWFKENEEARSIVGIDYSPEQLFWIFSMSERCFQEDSSYVLAVHKNNLGVRQSLDFFRDFQCDLANEPNLSAKCSVYVQIFDESIKVSITLQERLTEFGPCHGVNRSCHPLECIPTYQYF